MTRITIATAVAALCLGPAAAMAQSPAQPSPARSPAQPSPAQSWEFAALPSIGYDADEGFGYGAFAEVYRHRPGAQPYAWTVQPAIDFSSRGRRDVSVFFDAPHLLPEQWRLAGSVSVGRHRAAPWYGVGNAAPYDPALDDRDGPNPYYYRFERSQQRATLTVQRQLGGAPFRLLLGAGAAHVSIDATPYDEGTTLLAQQLAAGSRDAPGGWSNYLRAGLIRDTRDREVGPVRGSWSEVLVQRHDAVLGSSFEYTRWTATDRRYFPIATDRLVFANRLLLQGIVGDAPFHDLPVVQSSFKQQEGLGGAKTLRGIPKNRYVGNGLFLWNSELRWRAADFHLRGTPLHLVLTGFVDQGRVWDDDIVMTEILTDLHRGVGGGVRLGRGNFVAGIDVGHSADGTAPMYIGLGYLF
jgi:hypothetical protein